MPNDYSIEIHNYISDQIAGVNATLQNSQTKLPVDEGRLLELQLLRDFLREHIDLKDFTYY